MLLEAVGVLHNDRDVMSLFLDTSLSRPPPGTQVVVPPAASVDSPSGGGTAAPTAVYAGPGQPQISLRLLEELLMAPVDKTKGSPRSRIRTRSSSTDLTASPAPLASTAEAWTHFSEFEQQLPCVQCTCMCTIIVRIAAVRKTEAWLMVAVCTAARTREMSSGTHFRRRSRFSAATGESWAACAPVRHWQGQ